MTGRRVDAGQVLPLVLIYTLVAFLLVTVVVDAASVHLERNRLMSLADSAALNAAGALDQGRFYRQGAGVDSGVVPVSDDSVQASVQDFLVVSGAEERFTGLAVGAPTGSPDGTSVQVTLVAVSRPPVITFVVAAWAGGIPLRVTSRARAVPFPVPAPP